MFMGLTWARRLSNCFPYHPVPACVEIWMHVLLSGFSSVLPVRSVLPLESTLLNWRWTSAAISPGYPMISRGFGLCLVALVTWYSG